MSHDERHSCQCLCGGVRFQARVAKREMGVCHCSMCRRWSGGVFMAVECSEVVFDESQSMQVYASSHWGERCFCSQCGSTLMWRSQDRCHHAVSVQAFEDPGSFQFVSQIFIDEKPANYSFAEATRTMTGAEVNATYPSGAQE